jgi:hypothetical protein
MKSTFESTSDPHPNPLPEGEGTKRVGVIETDLFCDHCGFNLHTQNVWRDERLSILVCRCPECGRHQAAGERTTAAVNWLQRVALAGAMVWIIVSLLFVVGVFFFAVGIHAAAEEGLTYRRFETTAGEPVGDAWNTTTQRQEFQHIELADGKPVIVPAAEVVMRRRLAPWLPMSGTLQSPETFPMGRPSSPGEAGLAAFFLGLGWFLCAVILAAGSWFWRPAWRAIWLLVPVLAGLFVWILVASTGPSTGRYWNGVIRVDEAPVRMLHAVVVGLNVLILAIGLLVGRPIARLVLKVFCPPRLRQLFAFLWLCDGKTPPVAAPSYAR